MKRLALLIIATVTMCPAAWGGEVVKILPTRTVGDVTITCREAGGWTFDASGVTRDGVEYVNISLSNGSAQVPPEFSVGFSVPQKGMYHLWEVNASARFPFRPDWSGYTKTNLATGMPLWQFFGDNNDNALTVACDEVFRDVVSKMALREEGCLIVGEMKFFTVGEAPLDSYSVTIRLDGREAFWADCIREASLWMRESSGCTPCRVPDAAWEPLYSSWYQFHQDLHQSDVEEECRIASSLGMKTLIIDDGWQTDDNSRGYAFCGDWKVSQARFPDFIAHVGRVQEMGMKYMMWYSVPFIGIHSENFERFQGKYLYHIPSLGASVLDPRFPEVREFLTDLYLEAAAAWGLDGFKLDFIDSFTFFSEDPAVAENYQGRDILTVPAAVNALMVGVRNALQERNPDVLIEFRQQYVGPAIAMYGNMFRVGDCPGDRQQNRIGICNLRLAAPGTAIHSDMIEWNPEESPEQTARDIISAIFGVIQYSVMLRDIPLRQRDVIRHWIGFSQDHKDALLKGWFRPYHPESGYPLIEAGNDEETITAVYEDNTVAPVRAGKTILINATGTDSVITDLEGKSRRAAVYDTYGHKRASVTVGSGLSRTSVPSGGYIILEK